MIHGRILDLDSHLQVPISRWGEVFGEATSRFGKRFAGIPLFDATDEPDLTTESVWNTKGTAAPGASNPESRLAIEGHTDSVGAGEANLALSQSRAFAVSSYLEGKGVSRKRMSVQGMGENAPVASNDSAAGRQLNRRVEATILD